MHTQQASTEKTLVDCFGKSATQKELVNRLLGIAFYDKTDSFELADAKLLLQQARPNKAKHHQVIEQGKVLLNKGEGS